MQTQEELIKSIENSGGYYQAKLIEMPATKIQAFLEQFPWVSKYAESYLAQVYVSGIDARVVTRVLEYVDIGFDTSDWICEKAYLLDKNFELVEIEKEKEKTYRKYIFFGKKLSRKKLVKITSVASAGETIWGKLQQLGEKANSIYYILSYYRYTHAAIVHKSPKGISVIKWIEDEINSQKAKFQKTCDEIDAQAKA